MGGQQAENEDRPTSNFVHLSYKSLVDFENLQRTEDSYVASVVKEFSHCLVAATTGAYIAAKSSLFQDRIGAFVITCFLAVILANTPSMNANMRKIEGYGVYFFSGTCLSTILWWNCGYDQWNVIRGFAGFAISGYFYTAPYVLLGMFKTFKLRTSAAEDKSSMKRSMDTNRFIFYLAGPLANFAGLVVAETVIKYILGISVFLPADMRLKTVLVYAIWNFIHGQFNIVKCRLYDRDLTWQTITIIPETFLALFFVPKSILVKQEDDY